MEWETMTTALAAETPWWEPGTKQGYHALRRGYLLGEELRRGTGKTMGTYWREEIAGPLKLDFHSGLDARHDSRCAEVIAAPPSPPGQPNPLAEADPESITGKALNNPPGALKLSTINSRAWRGAEVPAANGHTNARSLAKFYSALARGGELDGVRVLTEAQIEQARTEQSNGPDAVLYGLPTRYGLGFRLPQPAAPYGPNPHTFGHTGAGGSLRFSDPIAEVRFAYTVQHMGTALLIHPRVAAVLDASFGSM